MPGNWNWILPFLFANNLLKVATLSRSIPPIVDEMELKPQLIHERTDKNNSSRLSLSPYTLSEVPDLDNKMTLNDNDGDGLKIAAELLTNSLNESMNPCEDFFEFTCGKWLANNQIPKGSDAMTQFSKVGTRAKEQLQDLFDHPKPSSSKAINQLKTMYGTCRNYNRTKQNPSILLQRIGQFGGWPILRGPEWDEECFNLPHVLAKFRLSLGLYDVLVGPNVELNRFNVSQQAIHFYPSSLVLEKSIYGNQTKLEEYAQRITRMVKILASDAGIELCDEDISREVNDTVEFEKELASFTNTSRAPEMLNLMKFNDLVQVIPELDFSEYFKLISPSKKVYRNYFASDPDVLFNDFLGHLSALLRKTNKRTVANYVILRYVMEWAGKHLDDRLEKEPSDKRDNVCIEGVIRYLEYASGALYIRNYFGNDSKNSGLEMVDDLRAAFRTMLGQNSWMDPVTKKRALSKLDKVIPLLGFPDFMLNDTELDKYYEGLNINDHDSYPTMLAKTSKFNTMKMPEKLLKPTDRTAFPATVYEPNAFFEPKTNTMTFPAAILQPHFFHKSFPKAMNYGGIGAVIGHELTHGFDDLGAEYDEQGNLKSWWEPETKANFRKQKQCLIDEYSAFQVPEVNMTVNGTLTAQENIADNGGLKEAYLAYQSYLKKLGHQEKQLPGFERFTSDQLFFISFGHFWCGKRSEEKLRWQILSNGHSPNRNRVNGAVPNMPEFSAAFKCPEGAPMNPAKKCRVW